MPSRQIGKNEPRNSPEARGGITPSSFFNPMDLSPVLPQFYYATFQTRECGGVPGDLTPQIFRISLNQQDVIFDGGYGLIPMPIGVPESFQIFKEECLALFSDVTGPPDNLATLVQLLNQLAQDFFLFRSYSFDSVFIGICAIQPTALTDVIEFAYDDNVPAIDDNQDGEIIELVEHALRPNFYTRIQSEPWTGYPDQFQHWDGDSLSGLCIGGHDRTPGILMLAPGPSDGKAMMEVLTLEDGRLKSTYDISVSIGNCCGAPLPPPCGCLCITITGCTGQPVLATVTVSATGFSQTCSSFILVSSVTITNQGAGYTTPPTVTFSGGGGSGAAGTAVLGTGTTANKVTSITITSSGSGYTTPPTVTFTGGAGSGAAGAAVLASRACIQIKGNASYTITVSAPGFITNITTSSVTTDCDPKNLSISLAVDSAHVCCPGCLSPIPKILHVTDPNGTFLLTYDAPGSRWIVGPITISAVVANGPPNQFGHVSCPPTIDGVTEYDYAFHCSGTNFVMQLTWIVRNCSSPLVCAYLEQGVYIVEGGAALSVLATVNVPLCTGVFSWTFNVAGIDSSSLFPGCTLPPPAGGPIVVTI